MNEKRRSLPLFGFAIAAAVVLVTPVAFAQQPAPASPAPAQNMPGMKAMPSGSMTDSSAHKAMMDGMQKMNQAMMAAPDTGDADKDFVAMMIPHHQGAIDMAKVELANGKDPTIRKMAKDIVAAQQREIKQMTAWQAKHPSKP